jgi:hypothetical protein
MPDKPLAADRSWKGYAAIALVSASVLLFEIAVTRILSVVLWYHFAFLAVSLAMLGLGLPGVWLTLRRPGPSALRRALLASGVVVPGSVATLFWAGERVTRAQEAVPSVGMIFNPGMLVALACVLLPFLCLGTAVCLLLMRAEGRLVGRMYAADLLGATVGAALVVPLMHVVPTPHLVAGAGLLPLVAAVVLEGVSAGPLVVAPMVAGAMIWGQPFKLRVAKSYVEPQDLLFMQWTPTARITVFPDIFYLKDKKAGFGWGMGDKYKPVPLDQLWIEQDGSAGTPITRLATTPADLHHLFFDVTSAGYQLRPPKRVAIVGAGGGRDILTAKHAGAEDVDAVELNPAIVGALSGPFREFSGDVYHLPGVHAHVGEGRSFLTHAEGGYDLLQISLIDSWAATAAGAFSLSENYLYTIEALRLYLRKLGPDGLLSISRWMQGDRQLEGARLSVMLMEALRREGVAEPEKHLGVVQSWSVGTFLVSKTPLGEADVAKLDAICQERGFRRHWPRHEATPGDSVVASVLEGRVADYEKMGVDLSPATDDRPFFFQTLSLVRRVDSATIAQLSNNEQSVALLRMLLGVVSVLTLALFFVPFALSGKVRRAPGLVPGSLYFLAIGVAFMLVEMPMMQRFVLYLGHPSYATTVVLAAVLVGAGMGSAAAARADQAVVRRFGLLLPAFLVAADLALGPLFQATLGAPFAAKLAVSAAVLVPAGFLMGFPFPAGMVAFGDENKPWLWAMNGAASVLASVFSLAVSMVTGFVVAGLCGAVFYCAAYALLLRQTAAPARPA